MYLKIVDGVTFINAYFIFPPQQRDVQKIVDAAKKDPNVKFVIIFGSSVTWSCGPFSDIDKLIPKISEALYNVEEAYPKDCNDNSRSKLFKDLSTLMW